MSIAIISDIHLGRGDRADRKRGHDEALLKLLDYLEAHHDRIILLGDIWELLTAPCPGRPQHELKQARDAHPELALRFSSANYSYVVGNHDHAIEDSESLPQEICVEMNHRKIIFTHGHQFDIWAHQLRYLGEFIVWISAWASRLGTDALSRFFDGLHTWITSTSRDDQFGDLELELIKQSIQKKAHVTVIGHTHVPSIKRYKNHLLVNSGHCIGESLHFVSVDADEELITVYKVKEDQRGPISEEDLTMITQAPFPHLNGETR